MPKRRKQKMAEDGLSVTAHLVIRLGITVLVSLVRVFSAVRGTKPR